MDLRVILPRIRVGIFLCVALFVGSKYFTTGSFNKTYKLKEDISRVENENNFSINFEELTALLEEIDPDAKIEPDRMSRSHEYNGQRYYSNGVTYKGNRIRGYYLEEGGKLLRVEIFSGRGTGKDFQSVPGNTGIQRLQPTTLEFKDTITNALKRNAATLNNVLNQSSTAKELNKFLNANIKKNIKTGVYADIGDTNVLLFIDDYYLVLSFAPKSIVGINSASN